MSEYVLTISKREAGKPLSDLVLIEAGQHNPASFAEAVGAIHTLLVAFKTPEAVATFVRDNATAAKLGSVKSR